MGVSPVLQAWLPVITALLGGGFLLSLATLAKVILDHQRRKREQTDGVALKLVETQGVRITALEAAMKIERENCAREISRIEQEAVDDRRRNAALDQLRRHQVNNSKSAMQMTVDLLEVAPDRLDAVIPRLRDRLKEHERIERQDMAAYMAAHFGSPSSTVSPHAEDDLQ